MVSAKGVEHKRAWGKEGQYVGMFLTATQDHDDAPPVEVLRAADDPFAGFIGHQGQKPRYIMAKSIDHSNCFCVGYTLLF
jgi:hypothetical protein